jgi:RND superfamily putative drug exporter
VAQTHNASDSAQPSRPTDWPGRIAGWPCGRRGKYLVLAFWIVAVAVAGPLAGKFSSIQKNDASSYLPATAESTKVLALQSHFLTRNFNPAVVIYTRRDGLRAADLAKAAADARAFASLPQVGGRVVGPVLSPTGKAAEVIVGANLSYNSDIPGFIDHLRTRASNGDPGVAVYLAGPAASGADQVTIFKGIDSTLLYATVGVVVVLLLITYRSPLLWLLPITSAGVSLVIAEAVIYLLASRTGLVVNGQTAGILVVLVLGASTDYALLLVARYREELRHLPDRHDAMRVALRRAGPAIIASSGTVIAGMLCLLLADSANISGLGPVAAIGIALGLIAMVTLLPALLVLTGRWMFWPRKPRYGTPQPATGGFWARTGRVMSRRPRIIWIAATLALVAAAFGLIGFRFGPLTLAQSFVGTPSSVTGERVLARYFPAGSGEPAVVIGNARAASRLRAAVASTAGISSLSPPRISAGLVYQQATLSSPPDSPAARATVRALRAHVHAVPGADAKVGGTTAINLDVAHYAARDRNLIIPVVLAVVFVILGLLLRALVAPLLLVATVVLSFAAALGLSSLVFEHLFGFAGADTSVPLFVFVFLVALGIDYNIFLMTRVREETRLSMAGRTAPGWLAGLTGQRRLEPTEQGALIGLAATGGVITSAGLVLAGTFATLATLPLVVLTEIGFTVALGVLLDTLVVRSILVTSLTLDLGRWMWWPGKLARPTPRAPGHPLPARKVGRRGTAAGLWHRASGPTALPDRGHSRSGGSGQPSASTLAARLAPARRRPGRLGRERADHAASRWAAVRGRRGMAGQPRRGRGDRGSAGAAGNRPGRLRQLHLRPGFGWFGAGGAPDRARAAGGPGLAHDSRGPPGARSGGWRACRAGHGALA